MIEEIRKDKALSEEKKDELIVLTLRHEMKFLDEVYVKIKSVHNDIVGHGGVETTVSKLAKGYTPWKYMRIHVRQFIKLCATCQKMSNHKFTIFTKPFLVATYSPMVRLNIDFVGPINTDDDSGYILVIIDTSSKWVELYPCENATAKAAAGCLLQHSGTVRRWQSLRERTHHRVLSTRWHRACLNSSILQGGEYHGRKGQ